MSLSVADYGKIAVTQDCPWRNHQAITKSDSTTYDPPLRGLFVGGAGDVVLTDLAGVDASYTVPAGAIIDWLIITKVKSTGTTATLMVGGY